ncbi:MAG: sulfite exporter TauE/SafE family protein [Gammaproteobacteria bacterium]|nr:sulfite exporter TauE/SafE family protein [Gammaproteobacteria bacterium]
MDPVTVVFYVLLLAIGAYVQTVTGFALGLFVMGIAALVELDSVAASAAIVTISSLVNTLMALAREHHHVNWPLVRRMSLGLIPAMLLGVSLLHYLSQELQALLRLLLGGFIVTGAVILTLKPHPRMQPASGIKSVLFGMASGLFGGLFSTGGPPAVYHLYREPIAVSTVRMTLLAVFTISTLARLLVIVPAGHVSTSVVWVCVVGAPVIIGFTWLGQRFVPPISDTGMRRLAFFILLVIGLTLLASVFK